MSSFTTPLKVEVLDSYNFKVFETFKFYDDTDKENIIEWEVPTGFITDFASVPRIFWALIPPNGKYTKAAVLHDWMYKYAIMNKAYADLTFYRGMLILGVPQWKAYAMYKVVSMFGKGSYV